MQLVRRALELHEDGHDKQKGGDDTDGSGTQRQNTFFGTNPMLGGKGMGAKRTNGDGAESVAASSVVSGDLNHP